MSSRLDRLAAGAVGSALALASGAVCAQASPGTAAPSLPPVTVIGNPLGSADLVAPASRLSGTDLLLRRQGSLGETLDGTAGISSTYFGPQASRPVIRGLDGDRIRILANGGAMLDASNLSYDHAVAADPLSVESIEVLRGPGALLYGGTAIGGAVNIIDNRIPRERIRGVSGRADASFASGNRERAGAVLVEGGTDRAALHVDAFSRAAGDQRVPADLACAKGGTPVVQRRICNSAGDSAGGAVGGSVFFDNGYLGASVSQLRSNYGSVSEDEVNIDLNSTRYALAGELRWPRGIVRSLRMQASHSDYRHTELEAGVPGTEFKVRGTEIRLEARHAPLAGLEGVVGLQTDNSRFSAVGEEAFAPPSRTGQAALFVYEELPTSWGKLTFGARAERVSVESSGSADVPRFTPAERSFGPRSAALGAQWKLSPAWQLTANLSRSERAPTSYELFADGPHVATGAYEVGNATLGKERATQADVGLQWKAGGHFVHVTAFASRFANFVALLPTGVIRDLEGELLPEYAYQGIRARLRGLEANGNWRLLDTATRVDLQWRADAVRATNASVGEPMPRIAPLRVGVTLAVARGPWNARLGVDHAARQGRVPAGEMATPAYTLWNASLGYRMEVSQASLNWYLRLENGGDRLAYSATSILTQTAPGRVPLPGRSVKAGVQATF